jgi:hypothetical protein
MLCSVPRATKAITGNRIPRILPLAEREALACHTAGHTSMLASAPSTTTCTHGSPTFASARVTR